MYKIKYLFFVSLYKNSELINTIIESINAIKGLLILKNKNVYI